MTKAIPKFSIFSDDFKQGSYPIYDQLREHEPFHYFRQQLGEHEVSGWLITRYKDAASALKDSRFTKDVGKFTSIKENGLRTISGNMLFMDPPDHTRFRALAQQAFTPRAIAQWGGLIQQTTNQLLDHMQSKGETELVEDFAYPLPITVISQILGIPQEDHRFFRECSNAVITASPVNPDNYPKLQAKIKEFNDYLISYMNYRRNNLQDDLLSSLLVAEIDGDQLSQDELLSMLFLLIIAGHETTVNLIGNGVYALLQHPDQLQLLRDQPELIDTALDEMLRYHSPVEFSTQRFVTEDMIYEGVEMKRGEMIVVSIGSANRDERQFPQADKFDITRKHNKHLAFGSGIHFCLGAQLARMEGRIALLSLLDRFETLEWKGNPNELTILPGFLMRGFRSLPIVCK